MDALHKYQIRRDLVIAFAIAAVAAVSVRKIYRKLRKPFLKKEKWLRYLMALKKNMEPMFSFECTRDVAKYGLTSPPETWTKENPRPLILNNDHAIDSINIWGADMAGNTVMLRMARRPNRSAEVWIYLRLETGEEFQAPIQPDLQVYNTDGNTFSAKGLYFEVLEPLRRIRIGFNGQLRKGVRSRWSYEEGETVYVKFNFIWHPMYNYSMYPFDFNPALMETLLCKRRFSREFHRISVIFPTEWHEQWGQLHGPVEIDGNRHVLMLTGTKTREYGVMDWNTVESKLVIKVLTSAATGITLYGNSDEDGIVKIYHGQVAPPSCMELYSVSQCKIKKAHRFFDLNCERHKRVSVSLVADTRQYDMRIRSKGHGFNFYAGEDWEVRGSCNIVRAVVNGQRSLALIETYEDHCFGTTFNRQKSVYHLKELEIEDTDDIVVSFSDDVCKSSKIVGGKGASLALLTSMVSTESDYKVPRGICLTKTCFEHHLFDQPGYLLMIKTIEDAAWRGTDNLSAVCERLDTSVFRTRLSLRIKEKLLRALRSEFGYDFSEVRFAVRSSAIGEDGEDSSGAGQNETILGVKGLPEIHAAIQRCWASQFSFRSVEYRRQNGQLINSGMGVVIQEMVPAQVAGVIFSKHPTTGDVTRMAITSSYGLGESVVSALTDPDTIILSKTWDDELGLFDKTLGYKATSIVLDDASSTQQIETNEENAAQFSISDEMALRLGKIVINLEKAFGNYRDVEWAAVNEQIYILQARPVTTDSVLTEFEVQHEFDNAFRTQKEHLSTGNVAEVMPGALSPLALTSHIRSYCINFKPIFMASNNFRFDPTIHYGTFVYVNHMLFDMVQQKAPFIMDKERDLMSKATDIGVFGRVLDDNEFVQVAKERYEDRCAHLKWKITIKSLNALYNSKKLVTKMEQKFNKYPNVADEYENPNLVYAAICDSILDINEAFTPHLSVTVASMIWNNLILVVLARGAKDFSPETYAEFGKLIGSSIGTISGEVPLSLKEIVGAIAIDFPERRFCNMEPTDAYEVLMAGQTNSSKKFLDFLSRHGHRGMKEFDVRSTAWGSNHMVLVKMLQGMSRVPPLQRRETVRESTWQTIVDLSPPLGCLNKRYLNYLLNRSKNAVCIRERAKSMLVKFINSSRLAFYRLAELMVQNGYIPDADLLFFMTFEEIGQLLETRSARIIMRARRRKRHYPYMDHLIYPELSVGVPIPLNEDAELVIPEGHDFVRGLPVCHGRVVGKARVITFDQVDTIEPNDILITHATDIGWSPYFPILGGVVTEIGGLVSHGAVVAREYGLPCIIGAENATKVFHSGDHVQLNATTGIITKVPNEE